MEHQHHYELQLTWCGNRGTGTQTYNGYDRNHLISSLGKATIEASSDHAFRGDRSKYNPEELLVASLSSCHMLWFLHLCSEAGFIVEKYSDQPRGTMVENREGGGRFTEVILYPKIVFRDEPKINPDDLHDRANKLCFIANSCNFPVRHEASFTVI